MTVLLVCCNRSYRVGLKADLSALTKSYICFIYKQLMDSACITRALGAAMLLTLNIQLRTLGTFQFVVGS